MSTAPDIAPELQKRIDAIAARSGMTRAQVIADALENGYSLDWQERFIAKVEAGRAAAARGDFATPEDMERVRNKYRSS